MGLKQLRETLKNRSTLSPVYGTIVRITATTIVGSGLSPGIGDVVRIIGVHSDQSMYGMVSSLEASSFTIIPFGFIEGFRVGDQIHRQEHGMKIPVGNALLGRVVNPFMEPLDEAACILPEDHYPIMRDPTPPLRRGLIDSIFPTGVKTIDGLLTCGHGQKMGIFAGSGVGKSTLMGMIVRGSVAPIKVIALIGERGREIPEFIANNLGNDLTNTVIIAATSDDSPLMRKYGAMSAMSVAEFFRDRGHDVLFMMDSVTRFAMAQREIGLALGEPPTTKGYPPSVFALLPQLMERAGKESGKGSITAFFTVLIEGDDINDPIADQARSILDGHIFLSRELTDFGIYPPINILNSASRLASEITAPEQQKLATATRRMVATLKENETLVRIGAYQSGSDPELDIALKKRSVLEGFLKQNAKESFAFDETLKALNGLFKG